MKRFLLGTILGGLSTYAGISYYNINENQGLSHNEYQTVNAYIHHHRL